MLWLHGEKDVGTDCEELLPICVGVFVRLEGLKGLAGHTGLLQDVCPFGLLLSFLSGLGDEISLG